MGADEPPRPSGPPDARLQLLVAEYTWVAGLVRYYREVELKALAGTGLVLSGVGAAFAALRAADSPDAGAAIGVVLAIGAAITAFVLPVVLMASMRGLRAVVYVREWLHPLAARLAQDARFLACETVARRALRRARGTLRAARRALAVVGGGRAPRRRGFPRARRRGVDRGGVGLVASHSRARRRRAICCSSPPRSASRASPTPPEPAPRARAGLEASAAERARPGRPAGH